ncbi:MFS transporter [Candidatus Dojkabacteria bacterium]|uniref:MFS transporter n=1 Tax=Candidatus Dojkabacteria bacterium TaxID=2099670 RepID=A0A955L5Z3_9BACT|nr:MFS transporter [Candidatus Dojkabacteria bacterium]
MRFTTKIYLYRFFDDFVLIYPLYTVMFGDFGISPLQISILLAFWSGTAMLLEIPSGVLADMFSRKALLIVAQFIRVVGYLAWIIFPTFWGFLFGFVCWGIKSALTSGTLQALIYDELNANGKNALYTKVLGKTKTMSFIAILCSSLLASIAINWGYSFVLTLSTLALVLSILSLVLIKSVPMIRSTGESKFLEVLAEGIRYTMDNKTLVSIIIFLSFAFALGGALDEFWTLFADDLGTPKWGLGIFLASMSIAQATGNSIVEKFSNITNSKAYMVFIANGILLILAAYMFNIFSLVLLVVFSFTFSIIQTVFEGKLQHNTPTNVRATISSLNGFIIELFVLVVYFSTGYISQLSSYQAAFHFWGIAIIIIGLAYLLIAKSK